MHLRGTVQHSRDGFVFWPDVGRVLVEISAAAGEREREACGACMFQHGIEYPSAKGGSLPYSASVRRPVRAPAKALIRQ
jgi:hypothetical protein